MPVSLSQFARELKAETAFTVLAVAQSLKAAGKDVVELEIGDSPFPSTPAAVRRGIRAIEEGDTHYCPSPGLPELRAGAAAFLQRDFGLPLTADNVVVAHGAKIFELLFAETFLEPGDGVLVFTPHFPTYGPNIKRRGARVVLSTLRQEHAFRPSIADVEAFLARDPKPKAIFLNSPHNPTGGVATNDDLAAIADLVRGRDIAVFSDEPYCHMVWHSGGAATNPPSPLSGGRWQREGCATTAQGRHHSILAQPGMLEQAMAAYTFSKSYSMSGWRLGFAAMSAPVAQVVANLINTSLSCTPPMVQLAGLAALEHDAPERDRHMAEFRRKVALLAAGLNRIEGIRCLEPAGTFYVFPNVAAVCNRLGITSHGLAMYLLEGADDRFGVACLGGECFGAAGAGFLRFSCAEPDERIEQAVAFISQAIGRDDRAQYYLNRHAHHRLATPYPEVPP